MSAVRFALVLRWRSGQAKNDCSASDDTHYITRLQFLSDYEIAVVPSLNAVREQLRNASCHVVLLDFDLDDGKGVELFADIENLAVRPHVVAISSHVDGNALLKEAGAEAICPKNEFHKIEFVLRSLTSRAS